MAKDSDVEAAKVAEERQRQAATLSPDEWAYIKFALEKQYCAPDGTPPPSQVFGEVYSKLEGMVGK